MNEASEKGPVSTHSCLVAVTWFRDSLCVCVWHGWTLCVGRSCFAQLNV